MGCYLSLFSISVEHTFFADGVCKGLEFVPTPEASALLNRMGLLYRAVKNGIGVLYEDNRLDVLRSHIGDHEDGLTLEFQAFSRDPYFGQYTSPAANGADEIFVFDNRNADAGTPADAGASGGQTVVRLHDTEYVSEASFHQLEKNEYVPRPAFIVKITVADRDCAVSAGENKVAARCYSLAFSARRTFWKYYFLGDMAKKDTFIADLDGSIEFERATGSIAADRDALTFVSRAPISMQEIPDHRFQLRARENGMGGEKILIKRLPNASFGRIGKAMIDGKDVLVSEIYVNQ